MVAVGRQEGGLVDAQLVDGAHAIGVVDQWLAVLAHGAHHRVPADAEFSGHLRDRAGVEPDLQAALEPGPVGEQAPRGELLRGLGPGAQRARRLLAAPAALGPHQPGGTAERRQIPVLDNHPLMGPRHDPALRTADQAGVGLDLDHDLGGALVDIQNPEPGQAKQGLGNASSVTHRQGSPSRRSRREAATMPEAPGTRSRRARYPPRPTRIGRAGMPGRLETRPQAIECGDRDGGRVHALIGPRPARTAPGRAADA